LVKPRLDLVVALPCVFSANKDEDDSIDALSIWLDLLTDDSVPGLGVVSSPLNFELTWFLAVDLELLKGLLQVAHHCLVLLSAAVVVHDAPLVEVGRLVHEVLDLSVEVAGRTVSRELFVSAIYFSEEHFTCGYHLGSHFKRFLRHRQIEGCHLLVRGHFLDESFAFFSSGFGVFMELARKSLHEPEVSSLGVGKASLLTQFRNQVDFLLFALGAGDHEWLVVMLDVFVVRLLVVVLEGDSHFLPFSINFFSPIKGVIDSLVKVDFFNFVEMRVAVRSLHGRASELHVYPFFVVVEFALQLLDLGPHTVFRQYFGSDVDEHHWARLHRLEGREEAR